MPFVIILEAVLFDHSKTTTLCLLKGTDVTIEARKAYVHTVQIYICVSTFHFSYRVKPALLLGGTYNCPRCDIHQFHQDALDSSFQHAINHHKSGCHSCWGPLPLRSCSLCFQGSTSWLPPWGHELRGPHPVMYEADKCVTTAESQASSVNTLSKGLLTFIDSGQRNVFHSMTLSKYSATMMAAKILALALLTLLLDFWCCYCW